MNLEDLSKLTQEGNIRKIIDNNCSRISNNGREFLRLLIDMNIEKRPTVEEFLVDPWLQTIDHEFLLKRSVNSFNKSG